MPKEKIGTMTLVKKTFSCTLYDTWEVTVFEKDHIQPFTAHIFKYTLSGQFPLRQKEVEAWCLNILQTNYLMKQRLLDVRVNPCYGDKPRQFMTNDNSMLTYVLFEKPDGGYKLEEACNANCAKDRICRYSLKNLARGLLRLFKISDDTKDKYGLNFHLLKNAFYFGKVPNNSKVTVDLSEKYNPVSVLQTSISNFQKNLKTDFKHYFIIIPFLKFFRAEDIDAMKSPSDEEKASMAKIRMYQLGEFVGKIFLGFKEAKDVKVYQPGDNFTADQAYQTMDLGDIFAKFNKEEIENNEVYSDKYFGVKKGFARAFSDNKDNPQTAISQAKQNSSMLKDSFYEFIFKLLNFYGEQFQNYEEAIKHPFLTGQIFITKVQSDTSNLQ